jgi:TolA-binding protein
MTGGDSTRVERLAEAARATDARLDDIARARVLHGIQRQLTAEPPPRVPRRWRRWGAVAVACAVACAVAASAAVVALRPRPSASLEILRTYMYQGGPASQELLIDPTDQLTVGPGEVARAELAAVGRLTLRGPARLRVTAVTDRIELELERGQLFVDFDGPANHMLIVRSPGAEVRVVGTLFAVVAETDHSGLVVGRGSVEVTNADGRHEVRAGQAFRSDGAAAVPGPIAALLAEHDHSVLPPRGPWGLIALAGAPATARLAGEQRVLGVTPLVARVPVGMLKVELVGADGERADVEAAVATRKTNAVGYVLARPPAVAASRAEVPVRAPVAAPSQRAITPAPHREPPAPPPVAVLPEPAPEPPAEPIAPPAPTAVQLYEQAEAAMRAHQPRAARDALQRLIERFPDDREAELGRYDLARLAFEAGEWQAADEQLAALRGTTDPALAELSGSLDCRVAYARRELARAATCFETFRRRYPRSPHDGEMLARLAALRFDEGCERARPLLAEYLARYPRGTFAATAARGLERCSP